MEQKLPPFPLFCEGLSSFLAEKRHLSDFTVDVWASWVSTTSPDTIFFFFGLFVFKESFFVFLSVLASKFCSSVCCFPQAPLPLFFPKIPLAHNHYCWKTLLISNGLLSFPHLVQITCSRCLTRCCSSSSAPRGRVVFSTGTPPSGISAHYWGQGRRWLTKTLAIVQRNWVGRLLRGVPETQCFPSSLHKVAYLIHTVWS